MLGRGRPINYLCLGNLPIFMIACVGSLNPDSGLKSTMENKSMLVSLALSLGLFSGELLNRTAVATESHTALTCILNLSWSQLSCLF